MLLTCWAQNVKKKEGILNLATPRLLANKCLHSLLVIINIWKIEAFRQEYLERIGVNLASFSTQIY
jgi:hypothetical protein